MADRGSPLSRRVALAAISCAPGPDRRRVAVMAMSQPRPAAAVDTEAQQFILMDAGTGMVLAEKNADELMHPASMSKILTLYIAFEHLGGWPAHHGGHLYGQQKSVANERVTHVS